MANVLYPKFKENLLSGKINMPTDSIKVALISSNYSYSTSHENVGSIAAYIVNTPQTLENISITNGVVTADNVLFETVTGVIVDAVVLYVDSGVAATSYLIAYINESDVGLPLTPNGGDVEVRWDIGDNKIFKL